MTAGEHPGWRGEGAVGLQRLHQPKLKKNRFYRQDDIKRFAFLYPSAEIKHLNRMVTTKIEFKKKT